MDERRNRNRNSSDTKKDHTISKSFFKLLQIQIIVCAIVYLCFLGFKVASGDNYGAVKTGAFDTTYKVTNLYDLNTKLDDLAKKNKFIAFVLGRKYFYNEPVLVDGGNIEENSEPDNTEPLEDGTSQTDVVLNPPLAAGPFSFTILTSDISADDIYYEEEPAIDTEPSVKIPDLAEYKELPEKIYRPVPGIVTSPFGIRTDPINKNKVFHTGVDLRAPTGTNIKAIMSGTVEKVGKSSIWGNFILIKHDDGFSSFYAHLSKVSLKEKATVKANQSIGKSGNTGRSTGAHLHFEIRIDGKYIDPANYLDL